MRGYDDDIQQLKERVDCGMLLERLAPGWGLPYSKVRKATWRCQERHRSPPLSASFIPPFWPFDFGRFSRGWLPSEKNYLRPRKGVVFRKPRN